VIDERKRAARARRSAAAVADNEKAAAQIEEIEASIADKLQKVDRLKVKVASQRERVRKIEDKLIGKSVDPTLVSVDPSPSTLFDGMSNEQLDEILGSVRAVLAARTPSGLGNGKATAGGPDKPDSVH